MDSSIVGDSNLDDDYGESDAFSVVAVKPKARAAPKGTAKKVVASKAAPKKMIQTKLKAKATTKKRAKPDSEDEDLISDRDALVDESILSTTPPSAKKQKKAPVTKKSGGKPLEPVENESMNLDGPSESKSNNSKSATDRYQRITQREHIFKRPDTYVGSVERTEQQMWVFNSSSEQMEYRMISYVPGLYKIFDEILVNAADNKQNDSSMKAIKVTIDKEKGQISVENDGRGIPVEIHAKENMYIPEMIFGHLLTSSNYNDEEAKTTGGRNGFGAKLCNIFSTEFTLETQDSKSVKRYKQTWTNNMETMGKAKITTNKSADFTRVTFTPDYKRFGMTGMDDDFEALVQRRIYDLAGTVKGVGVYLNGNKIKTNTFQKYIEMYTKAIASERGVEESSEKDKSSNNKVIIENSETHQRWEIGFAVSDGSFQQVSFVNSIATTAGGTHVNYIADQICTKLLEVVKKKNSKGAALKLGQIRNHIFLFVNCLITNPAFTSQTKEQLTTKVSQFGSKCVLTEEFLKKIGKTEAVENILHFAQQKADQVLSKSDGNRRSRMSNPKLVDANLAGTRHGHECTLILTEGDSAKGLAVAGRAVLDPDRIGVFPLRGKMLNVRDASVDQISKNSEIQSIKQFLGLKHKQVYTDTKGLRYGHLMIMADQDHDGSHIKGLLINFLEVQFPSLLKLPDFFREFITPIVKVWKGSNPKKAEGARSFFTMPQYNAWKERHVTERGWHHKYYKGLGTSTTSDAQVYFRNLDDHLKEFDPMKIEEAELFDLAFSKKKADARKQWLGNFVPGTFLDHSSKTITYDDFVNRELILFSMADNLRSIPSVIDGLKPGQRKVLYACLNRNLVKDTKVVELAGYCSELTAYQHGEQSLQQTIIGLAQDFVGSNNVNCLEPSGNFGSRLAGGNDSASPRYIYTRLSPFAKRIFSPLDEPNLEYNTDDDRKIEPKVYCPVVPMLLLNGADGIGTGWSTSIPNYHPEDIVRNLKRRMGRLPGEEAEFQTMKPWFRGWKGTPDGIPEEAGPDRYKFNGKIQQIGETNEVEITELPIRVWTDDFKAKLEEVIKGEKTPSFIKDYKEFNDHDRVHFVIQMDEKHMKAALEEGLQERFKLLKTVATSNLVAFDSEGRIRKYDKVEDILEEFYVHRLRMYTVRKEHWVNVYGVEYRKLNNQARFVAEIIDNKLVVSKKSKPKLVAELRQRKYEAFPKVNDAKKAGETDDVVENTDDPKNEDEGARDFDYLLGLPIWSLTQERVDKLHEQMQNKKNQVEELKALSEHDLWCTDLDEFLAAWDARETEDQEIAKKIRGMGRRASKKIGAGKSTGKGRAKVDDDYAPKVSKVSKPAKVNAAKGVIKVEPTKTSRDKMMTTMFPPAKPKASMDGLDEDDVTLSDGELEAIAKGSRATAEESASGGRSKRAAAARAKNWMEDEESSESDEDKLLGDIGDMVKGIGASSGAAPATNGRVSLYEMSRPGSSSSGARGAVSSTSVKAKPKAKAFDLTEDDETNYEMLAKSSPHKSLPQVNNDIDSFLSDDDDELDIVVRKVPATKSKPAPRPKKAAVSKKAAPVNFAAKASKPTTLSPAAKAYMAKQNKMKLKPVMKKTVASDSEDDVLDVDEAISKSPEPRAAASRRPARAAVAASKAKKPTYVDLSDDDDLEIDDQDESALIQDEDSADDFDESD
ncbi:MAG: DNA topoisomerase 2 [Claussenomyces sp. TS43310]|nr:MAG: DNA topoisomerase 2 [Claussenomyces sp. TS43310]